MLGSGNDNEGAFDIFIVILAFVSKRKYCGSDQTGFGTLLIFFPQGICICDKASSTIKVYSKSSVNVQEYITAIYNTSRKLV